VETGRALNKQQTNRNLDEKHRQESKEQTRGNCGSRKKLAVARREMTYHTGVTQRKGHKPDFRDKAKTMLHRELQKDKHSGGGISWNRKQKWDKEQRPETAATKQEGIQRDPQGDPRTGVHEAGSWDVQQVTKNQELDTVEGSAPSETKNKLTHLTLSCTSSNMQKQGVWSPARQWVQCCHQLSIKAFYFLTIFLIQSLWTHIVDSTF
jgi:hypothetical protein